MRVKRKWILITLIVIGCMMYYWPPRWNIEESSPMKSSVIDCVYTWVNGSDEEFLATIKQYQSNIDTSRFDDKNELKYSLRSLEKFAPWIRTIYLVTNGQIPYWLNLNNPKIQVVAHDSLCTGDECEFLPTFSSSAIETWIHRIPGLSKQFLYMNDDIYLGIPIFPDDLYTQSNGVKVFSAWTVPDCTLECPWVYVGDGGCDKQCNNERCQFDGGDCDLTKDINAIPFDSQEKAVTIQKSLRKVLANTSDENIRRPPNFEELLRQKQQLNRTKLIENAVDQLNKEIKATNRLNKKRAVSVAEEEAAPDPDEFAQTLISTNQVLNLAYGFHFSRKVLAHVGSFLDRDIIEAMHQKFPNEVHRTRTHRFRSGDDLQFQFLYYNFLMSEKQNFTVDEIFSEFDTDASGSWSDREIRTLLAKVYNLPLDWSAVRYFENVILNCSLANWEQNGLRQAEEEVEVLPTLLYERYVNSNIPQVTKKLVVNCPELVDMLTINFGIRPKYKFHPHPKSSIDSNFKMLTSNVTQVVDVLDQIRKQPKKFNCINDNLSSDDRLSEENYLIRALLEDFYLSFFPAPSQYELATNFRNRFRYLNDYHRWTRRRQLLKTLCCLLAVIAIIGCWVLCFRRRVRYARNLMNAILRYQI